MIAICPQVLLLYTNQYKVCHTGGKKDETPAKGEMGPEDRGGPCDEGGGM